MRFKSGVRILALNGAPFDREMGSELVVGMIGRHGIIEGALSFRVGIDGNDATECILEAVRDSKFNGQIRIIATNGVALGGLNLMDFEEISESLSVGLVSITRKRPRKSLLKKALSLDPGRMRKRKLLDRLYKKIQIVRMRGLYVQFINIDRESLEMRIDEALSLLRIAHIVASGVGSGESRGRI
jgi:endonuclease V-like protein UPF0215 family